MACSQFNVTFYKFLYQVTTCVLLFQHVNSQDAVHAYCDILTWRPGTLPVLYRRYIICQCRPGLQVRKSQYMGVALGDLHAEEVMYMCVTRCAVDVFCPWLAEV